MSSGTVIRSWSEKPNGSLEVHPCEWRKTQIKPILEGDILPLIGDYSPAPTPIAIRSVARFSRVAGHAIVVSHKGRYREPHQHASFWVAWAVHHTQSGVDCRPALGPREFRWSGTAIDIELRIIGAGQAIAWL